MPNRLTRTALLVAAMLGGCAAIERQSAADRENMLAAAGFRVVPANTQARQDMLARLPPNRIEQRIEGEHVSYLYPDPVLCHCLYVGGQDAYGRYQFMLQQRRIADDQALAAQMQVGYGWDWGPWGGYGPAFY